MSYKVRYLTPEDQLELDPTGRGAQKIRTYKATPPTPTPSCFSYTGQTALDKYYAIRSSVSKHLPRYSEAWDRTGDAKVGPQGGNFPLDVLQEGFRRSYEYAERGVSFDVTRTGAQYLRRRIEYYVARDGLPQFKDARITGTLGALPSMDVKGSFVCETLGMKPYRHVFPDLPGERRQRNKDRVINLDSVLNVRYFEKEMSAIRNWLKQHFPEYFSGWLNPKSYLRPAITRAVHNPFVSCELDFVHCDECTSYELASETYLYALEPLLPPVVFELFTCFVEELFHQEIYFGSYTWTGKHNLLSGQIITNDVETIYDVCLMLGALLVNGIDMRSVLLFACGDDQTLILQGKYRSAGQQVLDTLRQEATANGHIISDEKSRLTDTTVRFCRREYHAAYAKDMDGDIYGVYPAPLTLNSIYNPERLQPTLVATATAVLQVLDNLVGHPLWSPIVQLVGASWREDKVIPVYQPDYKDWWTRLYGTVWSLEDSPSYAKMKQVNLMFK